MSLRHIAGVAAGSALLMLPAPSAEALAAPDESVTVDRVGTLTRHGTVTLTGTYRCTDSQGPVFVTTALRQGEDGVRRGIGGTRAVCDGEEHRWTNTARTGRGRFQPGSARVDAAVLELGVGGWPFPVPYVHATRTQIIVLSQS
ncbi:hypothetical protein FE633_28080 [Streptomyces montanus]|uniref:DUF6299 domain-containing protein n=1 Tax=Streptomyces montanus TaxID=2580423 RepID=A0A5R9FGS8_9ACTN|nr:DUF6299 family protein [Streptomyces montanus]TLS43017.1 hypothetical protein FE633_28080 [Streptomyces montanus]